MKKEEYESMRRVKVEVDAHPVTIGDEPPLIRRTLLVVGIVVIVAILSWAWLSREDTGIKSVPPQLIGLWTSSHPEYSDRTLVLKSDSITFGIGGTKSVRYSIIGVVQQKEDQLEYFVLNFRGEDGAKFQREVVLADGGRSLFFRSQPDVVWTKFKI